MSNEHPNCCGTFLFMVALACWARDAGADDGVVCHRDCEVRPEAGRTLGGHRYVPFSLVEWGFVESEFGATLSAGTLRLDDGLIRRSTSDDSSRLEFLAITQNFEGAAALSPWLGLSLRATGGTDIAISTARETPVAIGAQGLLGVEAGAVVRLIRVDRVQLSARGDVGWSRNFTPELLPGEPREDRDVWTVRPALVGAVTLAPSVGMQASGSYELRDIEGEAERAHRWAAAVGLSLWPHPAPVMFLVGGGVEHENHRAAERRLVVLNGSGGTRWNGELGVFYHGRSDLDLGSAFVFAVADHERSYLGQVRIKYYF